MSTQRRNTRISLLPALSLVAQLSFALLTGCENESTAPSLTGPLPALIPESEVSSSSPLYLHGDGGTANPANLFLDATAPTSSSAKHKDSPGVKFSGGNPWAAVGTWTAAPSEVNGSLEAAGPAQVWLGLKNSDDIGTRFDLRAEAYKNGTLVASGESRCIQGITRNANLAKEAVVSFDSFTPANFNGTTDEFALKILTRIGTTETGAFCGGHSNAVGLRLYFDATHRPANVELAVSPPAQGDTWTPHASMPTARWGLGADTINGMLYAVGGLLGSTNRTELEAYDPVTGTWTSKAPMPTARFVLGAATIDGVLYAIGGQNSPTPKLATLEAYDAATNTWSTKAPMPTQRSGLGVAVIDGILYAVGGAGNSGSALTTVEAYDPVSNTWTTKAPMPTPRHSLTVAALNGTLYAIGGVSNSANDVTTVEAYDPVTDTWTTKAAMPTGRQLPGAAVIDGVLYVVGGLNASSGFTGLATIEAYDPGSNTWSTKAPMPTSRFAPGVAALNGTLYAVGGFRNGALATLEAYHP